MTCIPLLLGQIQLDQQTCDEDMPFSLISTSTWEEFAFDHYDKIGKQEKSVWTESITLKSNYPIKLSKIVFQWNGDKIKYISGSLYQKRHDRDQVIPIESNLVGDGYWNCDEQQLTFYIDQKVVATQTYYLILSFPHHLESILKSGKFVLHEEEPLIISSFP
jgi:hypothetical protein